MTKDSSVAEKEEPEVKEATAAVVQAGEAKAQDDPRTASGT